MDIDLYAGKELVFLCLNDKTLRAYVISDSGKLEELTKLNMENPTWLLCDPERGVLFVGEEGPIPSRHIVRLVQLFNSGQMLTADPTPIPAFLGLDIKSCCIKNEDSILCFDMNKSEIVEIAFK